MDEVFDSGLEGTRSQPGGRSQSPQTLTARDYAHILLDRVWISVTVLVAVVAVAWYYSSQKTPLYQAAARLELSVPQSKAVKSDDVVADDTRDYTYVFTQIKALQSRSLAEKMVGDMGLLRDRLFTGGTITSAVDAAAAIQNSVKIENLPSTRMVDITCTHADAATSARLANGLADAFIKDNLDQRMRASIEALQWLQHQAQQYRANLGKSELALQEYKEKTLSSALVDQQNVVVGKLADISHSLTEAETQRLKHATEWKKVAALLDSGGDLTQVDTIASDAQVAAIKAEILDKQAEVAVLRGRYKEMHPSLSQPIQELNQLNLKIKKACVTAAETMQARLNMAQAQEDALRKAFAEQQARAFELDRKLLSYQELQRNVDADRELYNSVLTRMKETSVAGKMETNNIRLVDRALEPHAPFNINRQRDMLQAGLLGIFLGVVLSFLAHFADDRIKRSDDLEQTLGLPMLAVVPHIAKGDIVQRALTSERERNSVAAEAFRTLRASLSLSPSAKRARRIMVTSAGAGSGKSLVSSNLSIVLAHNGVRTLLVDADLRRPTLHRAFGEQAEIGLSHVLAGEAKWRDVLVPSNVPGLDVIRVGRIPPNPAELLGSQAMQDLLREASESYDKVILDCPPVFGLSDPLVLMPLTDGVIFVVHFNVSRRRSVQHALQKLREGQTPLLGAVMNNVNLRRPGGYYYYYHQYAYYYDNYGTKKRKGK